MTTLQNEDVEYRKDVGKYSAKALGKAGEQKNFYDNLLRAILLLKVIIKNKIHI